MTVNNLIIKDFSHETTGDKVRTSAMVDGDLLYFESIGAPSHTLRAEPFLAMALLEAMVSKRPLTIEAGPALSEELYARLPEVQAIYANWNSRLSVIPVDANIEPAAPVSSQVGSFFSAGIDSMHTLADNSERITHLVVSRGFDHDDDEDGWRRRWEKQAAFARQAGKKLTRVNTNARIWMESRRLTWRLGHGLYLSSIPAMLGFGKMLIPASHTYNELFPWGSHPLLDPLWSTESTQVIHYGAGLSRTTKTEIVLANPLYADNLVVCWKRSSENCGECPKCIRTMLAIELLGGSSAALPPLTPGVSLDVFSDVDEGLITFIDDLLLLARKRGRKDIERRMARYHRKYHRLAMLHAMDEAIFRGGLRRLKWMIQKPDWASWRVTLRGEQS